MTALYLERYLNYCLTRKERRSGKPIIGIAQTGSDLSPCNRHHLELAKRVREGIRSAGGIASEFPCHPIQETGKRPTTALDRDLAYLSLVEVLYGYPLDGVVLLTGCDKTTPACLMAAATVNTPAIVLCGGPMLKIRNFRTPVICPLLSESGQNVATPRMTLSAMCGRLRVGKSFLHVCSSLGRCSHVFGL